MQKMMTGYVLRGAVFLLALITSCLIFFNWAYVCRANLSEYCNNWYVL